MSRASQKRINYLLMENSELKLLVKKLLQSCSCTFKSEQDEKLVKSLSEKYMGGEESEKLSTKDCCEVCGGTREASPSGAKYTSKKCGRCYLEWKAEKRKQSGRR